MKTTTKPYVPKYILRRVRKFFPHVSRVVDSTEDVYVSVLEEDVSKSKKKDPANCAFANACTRSGIADGAMIGIGVSYLIRGNVDTRYNTTTAVAREIVSFDRHRDFAPGKNYKLSKMYGGQLIGSYRHPKLKSHKRKGVSAKFITVNSGETPRRHRTSNIRVTTSIG